jgi:hypothetical protein
MIPVGILQDAGIFLEEEIACKKRDSIAVNYLCNYIDNTVFKSRASCYWFEIFYIMQDSQKIYVCDTDMSMEDRVRPVSSFGGVSGSLIPIIDEVTLNKIGYILCYRNGVIDINGTRRGVLTNGTTIETKAHFSYCGDMEDVDCGYFAEMNLREFLKMVESTV